MFSTLDLISGYHAFEIHPDDREKLAFSNKEGHWQWKRVPFGLCNAAPFFVRQIASLLAGMTWEELLAFFDDLLILIPLLPSTVSPSIVPSPLLRKPD